MTGLDLIAILLLVPETRFERQLTDISATPAQHETMISDKLSTIVQEENISNGELDSNTTIPPKKTNLQLLSLWSGVPKGMNLIELFLRPFPFIVYPAVAWATLACMFPFEATASSYD